MKHLLPLSLLAFGLALASPGVAMTGNGLAASVAVADDALETAKKEAIDLLENRTEEGTMPGCYTAEARSELKAAIEAATTKNEVTKAVNAYKAAVVKPKISDSEHEYWYYLVSGPSMTYCQDAVVYDMSQKANEQLRWNDRCPNARCMWKFVAGDATGKTVKLVNKATGFYMKNPGGLGAKVITVSVKAQGTAFSLKTLGEQRGFLIQRNSENPVHADKSGVVVAWRTTSLGSASVWHFDEVSDSDLAASGEGADSKYKLVWADEFNNDGPIDSKYWSFEKGFVRNQEPQWYQEDNAVCEGGNLVITARKETVKNPGYVEGSSNWKLNRPTADYTSSSVITNGKVDLLYGRMEVRAKIPTSSGAWPAIWCKGYPATNGSWPACGEVDILEFYSKGIFANVAWSDAKGASQWRTVKTPFTHFTAMDKDWSDKYHVWRMDWDSTSIRLFLDDELLNVTSLKRTVQPVGDFCKVENPFKTPMFLLLNLALKTSDNIDESVFPLKYYIDYVRFYQLTDTPSTGISTLAGNVSKQWLLTADNASYVNLEGFGVNPVVQLCDLSGRALATYTPKADTTFELPSQGKGVFLVKVSGSNATRTAKAMMK